MIYKSRTTPNKLIGLHALTRRLSSAHHKMERIQEEFRRRKAGFGGEENFDKNMLEFRPTYPYAILHDLCLKENGVYFQIDSLLITPALIVMFEVKNVAGKIIVTANPMQFIRESPTGQRQVMQSPVFELERKEVFLKSWMKKRGVDLPVVKFVAFAYSNELQMEGSMDFNFAFNHEIPTLLYKLPIGESVLTQEKILRLASLMKGAHHEYNPFPLIETMGLEKMDVLTGVFCPKCGERGMHWQRKKWNCQKCYYAASDCHHELVEDWFYLISDRLTNQEFRWFSGVDNQDVAKRLLRKSGLHLQGDRRSAFYYKARLNR